MNGCQILFLMVMRSMLGMYNNYLGYDPILEFDNGWCQGYDDAFNWRYCIHVAIDSFNRGYVSGHKAGTNDRVKEIKDAGC